MNHQEPINELNDPLRQAVLEVRSDTLSESSANRLLTVARGLGVPIEVSNSPSVHIPTRKRLGTPIALVLVAVTAVIVAVYVSWPREIHAWERVLAAVAERPWLLEVHKVNNRELGRTWYGHNGTIVASDYTMGNTGRLYAFLDLENKTMDYFSERVPYPPFAPQPGKVFRSAIRTGNRHGIDAAIQRHEATVRGQASGMLLESYDVASQETIEISKAGSRFLEYHFDIRSTDEHHPKRIVIVVNPSTQLPIEKRVTSQSGKTDSVSFSFPRSGPTDIFELGVPRSAAVVDTRPNESVEKILNALRSGRTGMDPYFAVVTDSKDRHPKPRGAEEFLVWKEATRWRIEQLRKSEHQDPIPKSENATDWWHNYVAGEETAMKIISDGISECTYTRDRSNGHQPDPNNPDYLLIESYVEKVRPHRDPDDPNAYYPELLAEWSAYPKLTYGGRFEIDMIPSDGPSKTILLTVVYTNRIERLWLDPDRDYLALRHEYIRIENGQNYGTCEVLETIRTPSGKWLPSVVRTRVPLNNGGEQVRHKNFFYKFDVDFEQSTFAISDL